MAEFDVANAVRRNNPTALSVPPPLVDQVKQPRPTRVVAVAGSFRIKAMLAKLFRTIDAAIRPNEPGRTGHDEHAMQLAAAVLMVEVMRADHEMAEEEETKLVELIRRRYDLDAEETDDLVRLAHGEAHNAVSLHGFTRQLTDNLDVNERTHIVELLWELAFADGRIDRYEEHLVRQIAEWLYVRHTAFIRAKHRAAERRRPSQ